MKLYEEFKLYENMWNNSLITTDGKLDWDNTQINADTSVTVCELCGKVVGNGVVPLERNLPVRVGFNKYLYNVLGKNICYDCLAKTDAANLDSFFRTIESVQRAIDYFKAGGYVEF